MDCCQFQCVILVCLAFCPSLVKMKFYPEDMKSLQEDGTNLYKDGYGSFATAMEMAIMSQLRYNDMKAVTILMSMTTTTIAQMGKSRLIFIPELDQISEHMRRDHAFACLRQVHEAVLSAGEKAMSTAAENQKSGSGEKRPFPDVAPKYKKRKPGFVGATKMGLKYHTLKFDMYKTELFKSKQFTRFWQFTKPSRLFAGKGVRAVLGSKVGAHAAKVGTKVFAKAGVPLLDLVTFGMSLDTFIKGIKQKNNRMIAGGTIGMVGSIVGMSFFLACVIKGAAFASVWGPVGLFIGFLFLFAGLAVSLFWPPSPEEVHNALMESLKKISKASYDELGPLYNFMKAKKMKKFDDIYLVNQAALYYSDAEEEATRDTPVSFKEKVGPSELSFRERKALKSVEEKAKEYFTNSSVLHNGFLRTLVSPNGKSDSIGLDFNGLSTPDSTYNGITVFVYSDMIRTAIIQSKTGKLKGIDIDLTGDPATISHHVVIDRYDHMQSGKKVRIRTGDGHDSLSVNGPLVAGDSDVVLDADLGGGENTLNFLGASRAYTSEFSYRSTTSTFLGFFFDVATGAIKYRRGGDYAIKPMGQVKGVKILIGSAKPDFIHLTDDGGPDDFAEGESTSAFDQYKMDHFTAIQMYGTKTYIVDLTKIPKTKRKEFTIIDTAIDDSYDLPSANIKGHYPYPPYLFICYDDSEGMTLQRMVYKEFTLSIYRDEKDDGELKEMIRIYIKSPRWPEIKLISKKDPGFKSAWMAMELYKHSEYHKRRIEHNFVPIHEDVFPVHIPEGKNVTISGGKTEGTSHADFLRLQCSFYGTSTVDMGDGKDYICIGRDFLDGCVIDYKDPMEPRETLLMTINDGNVEFHMEYEANDNPVQGKSGKIIIKNAEKIINEYGQVLVDLKDHDYEEGADLNVVTLYNIETRKKMGIREEDKNCVGEACDAREQADTLEQEADEDEKVVELVGDDSNDNPHEFCKKLGEVKDDDGESVTESSWN